MSSPGLALAELCKWWQWLLPLLQVSEFPAFVWSDGPATVHDVCFMSPVINTFSNKHLSSKVLVTLFL